ncbi:hypothetical protein Hanom_Chr03g00207741 [Helianthus anomalus]
MIFMLQVLMSSSESSGLSDEHDPIAIVSDDEIAPVPEVFTSDSVSNPEMMSDDEDLYDFHPFALPDFGDDLPFVDDVLALPLPIYDQLINGHPDGEHVVEPIPIHAISLTAIPAEDWPFIINLDADAEEIPVFHEDLADEDLGDGEVFGVAILVVGLSVVPVVDIPSNSDPKELVTSTALRTVGLEAYPANDVSSAVPDTPTPTPTHTPSHTSYPSHTTLIIVVSLFRRTWHQKEG